MDIIDSMAMLDDDDSISCIVSNVRFFTLVLLSTNRIKKMKKYVVNDVEYINNVEYYIFAFLIQSNYNKYRNGNRNRN